MVRRTLLDFFGDLESLEAAFLAHDDGYRVWTWTYRDLGRAARRVAGVLRGRGVGAGQAIAIWSENRPEWIAALWGGLLEGVVLVPIDYRASADFLLKVAGIVDAQAILVGETVDVEALGAGRPIWNLQEICREESPKADDPRNPPDITADTTAEIIFTSGATAEPKGVVLTHRNILANIVPIEREVIKYRKWARPFQPIRFLNLLPLSHMFGQAMATFVPPMLSGLVVFTRSLAPDDILSHIRTRRVSVLVSVPKILEVLKDHIVRVAPEAAQPPPEGMHWIRRWWRYRRIHRLFGFKFWAMVVGAAPLDPALETFWRGLGFVVVQGYGLTETAPIVTLVHPLRGTPGAGAVGKPIPGVEVKIAEDGEILVRGENVTRGYYRAPEETRAAFTDGWFHTGDIGEIDAQGQLHIRGRKKELIVTPEGLNVFPEDVERVLNAQPGVIESAVVGAPVTGSTAERVQAVLRVAPGTDVDAVVRAANAQLQDAQKLRAAAVWPGDALPRTEGTKKLKRREMRQWLAEQGRPPDAAAGANAETRHGGSRDVSTILARFAPGRTIAPSTTIDELGLSSLERVELMMAIEEAFQVTIDESAFASATSVADLIALTRPLETAAAATIVRSAETIAFPRWNRSWPARTIRRASLPTWILPLGRPFARVRVEGLEHLEHVAGPVLFAANHQSHFDTPVILDALPPRWRYRVAPAMAKEFFKAHFFPESFGRRAWFTNSLNYWLASLFFNAFPLPQREAGTRETLRYIGELVSDGYSVLIFPEGRRTEAGEVNRFQPGVGMIASRLRVPVVPVRLEGLERVLHQTWEFPRPGPVRVAFGPPLTLKGDDYAALAAMVEAAVRAS